jgi:hypothetical protein
VSDRVDAHAYPVQPSRSQAPPNRGSANTEFQQLLPPHHPMLPGRKLRYRLLHRSRPRFDSHSELNLGLDLGSPP